MDFRYLRGFQLAAKHLNFSQAAREARISVSALSRQIALLELGIGEELFIRSTRRVMLTPLGRSLKISLDRFDDDLKGLQSDHPIRIGCLQSVFEFFLADAIRRHPSVFSGPLDIKIGSPRSLREMMIGGELDLSLTNEALSSAPATYSGIRLYPEIITQVGRKPFSLRRGRPIIFTAFEHLYPTEDLKAPNRIRINSFDATLAMTRRKIGQAWVALPHAKSKGQARKAERQWIYLVLPHFQKMPERLRKIVSVLKLETSRNG